MPEYRSFYHCKHWESTTDKPAAVMILVRHELHKHVTQVNIFPGDPREVTSVMSGRIYALRVAIPGAIKPFTLANIWLPHSGSTKYERSGFLDQMPTLQTQWEKEGEVIWMGDFNAALKPSQRKFPPTERENRRLGHRGKKMGGKTRPRHPTPRRDMVLDPGRPQVLRHH